MFAIGSTVEVTGTMYEKGLIGTVIAHKPSNGDDVRVLITDVSGNPDAANLLGAQVTYLNRHLKGVNSPVPPRYVTRVGEQWNGHGHHNVRKVGKVTAVRVAKGDPSGRGGQFHGATNYREDRA